MKGDRAAALPVETRRREKRKAAILVSCFLTRLHVHEIATSVEVSQLYTVVFPAERYGNAGALQGIRKRQKCYGNASSTHATRDGNTLFLCDLLPYIKGSYVSTKISKIKRNRVLSSSLHSSLPSLFQK